MIFTNGLLKPWGRVLVLALMVAVFCRCGSSDDKAPDQTLSVKFLDTQSTSLTARGYANDPRIELSGPVGASYTLRVTDGASWCWTSRRNQTSEKQGTLAAAKEILYLFLAENKSGEARRATVLVAFQSGEEFSLSLEQEDYSIPATMDHPWAELPVYVTDPDWTYLTHYAPLSASKTARNYTICYDRKKRIANWIAYPIHKCYMTGSYIRPDKVASDEDVWKQDPDIAAGDQVYLGNGSYRKGGIRGHQCMSNHRYVPYKSDASLPSSDLNMQTFYSTNIMPQNYDFNGGSWLKMETVCTQNVCSDTLFVVTGTYGVSGYGSDKSGTSVAVPEYCWKVLLRTRSGQSGKRIDQVGSASDLISIGFWAANSSASKDGLKEYITSVASIEERTGFKFFPMLDNAVAEEVKSQNNPSMWSGIN